MELFLVRKENEIVIQSQLLLLLQTELYEWVRYPGGKRYTCPQLTSEFFFPSAGAVEYTNCISAVVAGETPPNEFPGYDTKQSDGEVPVMLWGISEYLFIAIAPWSTLALSDRTW